MSVAADEDQTQIEVFLDDDTTPIVTHRPPARFQLDTTEMADGPHKLHLRARDSGGHQGVRTMSFTVRNGPGIAVNGLQDDDILEGKLPILVNSYGGTQEAYWEPERVETPAPAPTWIWVLFLVIVAFAAFYGVRQWTPGPEMRDTPTYSEPSADKGASGDEARGDSR